MRFAAFGHAVGFTALLLGSAQAAAPSQQALFDGYVGSPAYRAILQKAYNDAEVAPLKATCPALTLVSLDKPEMIEAPRFVMAGGTWQMTEGAWVARATLDRCGTKVVRRAMVESAHNNTLRTRPLLPGEFAGVFKLEDAAKAYVTFSMLNVSGCKDALSLVLLDIKLKTKVTPAGWTEGWTAQMCGKTVTANVNYVAQKSVSGGFDVITRDVKTAR